MPKFNPGDRVYNINNGEVGTVVGSEYSVCHVDMDNLFLNGIEERYADIKEWELILYDDSSNKVIYEEDEYLGEMASIYESEKPSLMIAVNLDPHRLGVPYIKVYNTITLKKHETKVMRLHFLDEGMEYHKRDGFKRWDLNSKDIKNIKKILNEQHDDFPKYKVWDIAKCMWNLEFHVFYRRADRVKYLEGAFDEKYKHHPSYVPSTTPIPETWIGK